MSKTATVFILDVGPSMGVEGGSAAKDCLLMQLVDIIITERKTLFAGVVLLGTEATANRLAQANPGLCTNITIASEIAVPTGDLIKQSLYPLQVPEKTAQASEAAEEHTRGDYIDALIVAGDMIGSHCKHYKYTKRIVLITNCTASFAVEEADEVAKDLAKQGITVDFVGVGLEDSLLNSLSEKEQQHRKDNLSNLAKLVSTTGGKVFDVSEMPNPFNFDDTEPKAGTHVSTFRGFLNIGDPDSNPSNSMCFEVQVFPRTTTGRKSKLTRTLVKRKSKNGNNSNNKDDKGINLNNVDIVQIGYEERFVKAIVKNKEKFKATSQMKQQTLHTEQQSAPQTEQPAEQPTEQPAEQQMTTTATAAAIAAADDVTAPSQTTEDTNDGEEVELVPGTDTDLVDPSTIIPAYPYGRTLIPLREDEENLLQTTPPSHRGLDILGFIPEEDLPRHMLMDHSSIVVPSLYDNTSSVLFTVLTHAMHECSSVALARYARMEDKPGKLVILVPSPPLPKTNDESAPGELCFYMVPLPFAEEVVPNIVLPYLGTDYAIDVSRSILSASTNPDIMKQAEPYLKQQQRQQQQHNDKQQQQSSLETTEKLDNSTIDSFIQAMFIGDDPMWENVSSLYPVLASRCTFERAISHDAKTEIPLVNAVPVKEEDKKRPVIKVPSIVTPPDVLERAAPHVSAIKAFLKV